MTRLFSDVNPEPEPKAWIRDGGDGFIVRKYGATLSMSGEVSDLYPVHVQTQTERAYANAVAREWNRERRAAEQREYARLWSSLLEVAADNPVTVAVLNLHAPDDSRYGMLCVSCWDSDESAAWPCPTIRAVAGVYGIDVPEWLW